MTREGEKMYIHLGGEKIIRAEDIIAIFDLSIDSSRISHRFLSEALERSDIEKVSDEEPKSLIVAVNNKLYYSPISSTTLKKRAQEFVII